jgi:hypothetical protein
MGACHGKEEKKERGEKKILLQHFL